MHFILSSYGPEWWWRGCRLCNQCYRSPTLATEKSNTDCNQEVQDSPHPVVGSQKVTQRVTSSDTGWQQGGTGKIPKSLSGVGHVFGTLSKQVLAYEVLQNQCWVCDVAKRLGKKPRKHDCRKNWSKSAKAMEADMCVENVKAINESGEGVKVSAIIIVGDEDSSAIAHVREKVDSTVEKWSDINHVKKSWEIKFMSCASLTVTCPRWSSDPCKNFLFMPYFRTRVTPQHWRKHSML